MRQRLVRVALTGVSARLADRAGEVVNLSLGGALVRVNGDVAIGSQARMVMVAGPDIVDLKTRVLRSAPSAPAATDWLIAVEFLDMSREARRVIPKFLAAASNTGSGR